MKLPVLLFLVLLLNAGCDLRTREEALQRREDSLNTKEQQLLLREKTLQLQEQELAQREQKLDSTARVDSTHTVDSLLIGNWSVKMTCTETTCPGSAVGDTKTEQWTLTYEGTNLIARAMMNEQLARIYTGFYTGNLIELVEEPPGGQAKAAARMVVRLRIKDETHLEGQREIVRNDCKIVYDLQLEKKQ